MSTFTITIIFFSVLLAVLVVWLIIIELRLKKFLSGQDGKSLEGTIKEHSADIEEIIKRADNSEKAIKILREKFRKSIQGIGVVRFNPFKDSGGNHSFAIALLDEDNTGVVFSSLYARERISVFAKPIVEGNAEVELSDEEKTAVKDARSRLS